MAFFRVDRTFSLMIAEQYATSIKETKRFLSENKTDHPFQSLDEKINNLAYPCFQFSLRYYVEKDLLSSRCKPEIKVSRRQLESVFEKAYSNIVNSKKNIYQCNVHPFDTEFAIAKFKQNKKTKTKYLRVIIAENVTLAETQWCEVSAAVNLTKGKALVYKKIKSMFKGLANLDNEFTMHYCLYTSIQEWIHQNPFLIPVCMTCPNKTLFIPVLKPAKAKVVEDRVINGLFFERGLGDLLDHEIEDFEEQKIIAKDIILALFLMEKVGYFNLDLKPDNIVLFKVGEQKRAKIIDFGSVIRHFNNDKEVEEESLSGNSRFVYLRGTAEYLLRPLVEYAFTEADTAEKVNRAYLIRDRVALARTLIVVFNLKYDIDRSTFSSEWTPDFSSIPSLRSIYDELHDDPNCYSLLQTLMDIDELQKFS